jgi:hypothetical protein
MADRVIIHMDPPVCGKPETPFLRKTVDPLAVTCRGCLRAMTSTSRKVPAIHARGLGAHAACGMSQGKLAEGWSWEGVTCTRCQGVRRRRGK